MMRRPIVSAAPICVGLVSVGCASTVPSPESVVDAYVSAIEAGDCGAAFGTLAAGPETEDEFIARCREDLDLLRVEARQIAAAGAPEVFASVPLDPVREVRLVHVSGAWHLAEPPPVPGGTTPMDAIADAIAALEDPAVRAAMDSLGGSLASGTAGDVDALLEALSETPEAALTLYGETATVTVGDITLRLQLEDGTWRLAGVDQPFRYDPYDYDAW